MDQLINPSNDTSVSHPSIDLSNYTSLSYPQTDLQPMNYTYYTYPLIDLSNNSSINYLPVNLLDYNYPQINLSDNTSLSDDLPDYTFLGCLPIDLSNDTFISNPQIDLLNDLNHPQTNYSTSNNSSIDLSSDTSLNSPIDLPDNTSLSHPSIDLLNNTSLSYPPIDQTKELTSLNYPTQNTLKPEIKKCTECNKEENFANETHVIRHPYHKEATVTLSGNKVIDDFIISILSNSANYKRHKSVVNLEFVPYERFEKIKFVAEGGFSKIYKATWIDGPLISKWNYEKKEFNRKGRKTVALKELNNSKNIESKELNELKIFYNFILKHTSIDSFNYNNRYFGITQNPNTQNFMIITNYYKSGDLTHYISKDFLNISWRIKLIKLRGMIKGLEILHKENIVHQDYHSGNIFVRNSNNDYFLASVVTGDFGISKSAIETSDDDNEVYGIIPYVAPEVFQGQKYTKSSDIYSFGMIMWELMTGRRPFWDRSHDTDLIIEICDGLRPPIVTNTPEGYIELMQKCWHSDPNERPSASDITKKFVYYSSNSAVYKERDNPTKIISSPDIGPVTTNNPGAIYKSRPLSTMIKSANFTRSLRLKSLGFDKRKFNNNLIENNNNNKDKIHKRLKYCEEQNDDYLTQELEFDINCNTNSNKSEDNDYITSELNFDI